MYRDKYLAFLQLASEIDSSMDMSADHDGEILNDIRFNMIKTMMDADWDKIPDKQQIIGNCTDKNCPLFGLPMFEWVLEGRITYSSHYYSTLIPKGLNKETFDLTGLSQRVKRTIFHPRTSDISREYKSIYPPDWVEDFIAGKYVKPDSQRAELVYAKPWLKSYLEKDNNPNLCPPTVSKENREDPKKFRIINPMWQQKKIKFIFSPVSPIRRGIIDHQTGSGKSKSMLEILDNFLYSNTSCIILVPSDKIRRRFYDDMKSFAPEILNSFFAHFVDQNWEPLDWDTGRTDKKRTKYLLDSVNNILTFKGKVQTYQTDLENFKYFRAQATRPVTKAKPHFIMTFNELKNRLKFKGTSTKKGYQYFANPNDKEEIYFGDAMVVVDEVHLLFDKSNKPILEFLEKSSTELFGFVGASATPFVSMDEITDKYSTLLNLPNNHQVAKNVFQNYFSFYIGSKMASFPTFNTERHTLITLKYSDNKLVRKPRKSKPYKTNQILQIFRKPATEKEFNNMIDYPKDLFPKGQVILDLLENDKKQTDLEDKRRVILIDIISGLYPLMDLLRKTETPYVVLGLGNSIAKGIYREQIYYPGKKPYKLESFIENKMKKKTVSKVYSWDIYQEQYINNLFNEMGEFFKVLIFNSDMPEGIDIYHTTNITLVSNFDDIKKSVQGVGRINRLCHAIKGKDKQISTMRFEDEDDKYGDYLKEVNKNIENSLDYFTFNET